MIDPPSSRPSGPRSARSLGGRVRSAARLWRLYLARAALRLAPSEAQRLFGLTMLIGAACGFTAVGFHLAIQLAERQLIARAIAAPGKSWMVWTVLTPTAGGVATGALLSRFFPGARGSGIPEIKAAYASSGRPVRFRDALAKLGLSALNIGAGASLGREGPTVYICGGIARLLGRLGRVSPTSLRRLLPVGAAAGIAAAFNAPIAAVTFTIEEIVGSLDHSVLSGVIVAAAIAAVIERSVLGEHPVFDVPAGYGLHHASSLALFLVLGLAAGLCAVAFTDGLLATRAWFRRVRVVPRFARPGVGGLATGVLAVVALAWLRAEGVTGGGYQTLELALAGRVAAQVMAALCVLKIAATVLSYGSGGAGGIFAPSLFIGGMLGGAVGALDVRLLHHEPSMVGSFALVGMGAAFSGIVRAPMTSVLIIVEMTGGYSLMLPLMLANMTAYAVARRFRPRQIYDALLDQDGVRLKSRALVDALEGRTVGAVIDRRRPIITFTPSTRAAELVAARDAQDTFPVVDARGTLLGIVTRDDLELVAGAPELEPLVNAADVMRPPVALGEHDELHAALDTMIEHGVRWLPVVDDEVRVLGGVDDTSIAQLLLERHRPRAP